MLNSVVDRTYFGGFKKNTPSFSVMTYLDQIKLFA